VPGVAMSALRCKGGEERAAMRAYEPLTADHPCVDNDCAVCSDPLEEGDVTTVIPLGPGSDEDDQAKAQRGGWYSAYGVVAHASCAGLSG
jgi:hypothetical protein